MPQEIQTDINSILSDIIARTRVLESKYSLFGERMLIINKNMIQEYKKLSKDIKSLEIEITELKSEVNNVKEIMKKMIKEMENFAQKESLKILEKYINFWNPINFVTQKEVLKMIKDKNGRSPNRKSK